MRGRGPVERKVVLFGAYTAHHGQHVAAVIHGDRRGLAAHPAVKQQCVAAAAPGAQHPVVAAGRLVVPGKDRLSRRVQRQAVLAVLHGAGLGIGDAGVDGLLPPERREIAVLAVVFHPLFQIPLQRQIHRGIDAQTAVVHHVGGFLPGAAFLRHDVLDQLIVQRVGKVGIDAAVLLGRVRAALGQHAQRRGDRLVVFRLRDALLVQHQPQHPVAALQQGVRVIVGVIGHRAAGDGGQRGRLGQSKLGYVLAKIGLRPDLHTGQVARHGGDVQVGFQHRFLGIGARHDDGAADLAEFAGDGLGRVAGQVLHHLLFQRGSALPVAVQAVIGQLVDGGAQDAGRIDAERLLPEAPVLHADDRVLQVAGELFQRRPQPVGIAGEGVVLDPLPGVRVLGIDDRIFRHLQRVQIQLRHIAAGQEPQVRGQRHPGHAAQHDRQAGQRRMPAAGGGAAAGADRTVGFDGDMRLARRVFFGHNRFPPCGICKAAAPAGCGPKNAAAGDFRFPL